MEIIKDTVNSLMQEWAQKIQAAKGAGPADLLKKVLTKNEMAHIKCSYFKKGVLGLVVASSAVYYKLNLKKAQLLEKLNQAGAQIKDISLRMGDR